MLLRSINRKAQLLQVRTARSALDALYASLEAVKMSERDASTYVFLDNCIIRLFQKPVYYEDKISSILAEAAVDNPSDEDAPTSILLVALVEQWPYIARSEAIQDADKSVVASFLSSFLECCRQIGESERLLTVLWNELVNSPSTDSYKNMFVSTLDQIHEDCVWGSDDAIEIKGVTYEADPDCLPSPPSLDPQNRESKGDDGKDDAALEDIKALSKCIYKDVQDAIEDGDTAALVWCLSSQDLSTRMQALAGLAKFVNKVEASSYVEKEPMTVLLQETTHTAKAVVKDRPFPTFLAAFATEAISIEADPQHFLYTKMNRFLHGGPTWDLDRIPLTPKILLHPPEEVHAHYKEVGWFLDVVIKGLRTAEVFVVITPILLRLKSVFVRT